MLVPVAAIILAVSFIPLGTTHAQTVVPLTWMNIIDQPGFKIDIDPKSVNVIVRSTGFEMTSRLKIDFGKPFIIPGKTKLGAYYINDVVAKCNTDAFTIQRSTLYSADGSLLATGTNVAVIKNPKNPDSFISVWMHLSCNQFKDKRPPTII